ncbi:MAG: murein biosynthesis integral membrane protein MurJ [Lentisphaerae bacterium]|nr:murein biosynthesis integral membrane protein MurJ [Lentisphaerota bacterium]
MSFWKHRQQIGLAALIMSGSVLLSRIIGLIRDKVISYLFGAGGESDLYFAAFVVPDVINYLLAGAYFSITLIPLLAEHFARDDDDGWRLFSAVFTWVGVLSVAVTAAAMVAAPQLAPLVAPGADPERLVRLTALLRIVLPAQVAFLLGSCLTALLYLRKQFFIPAVTPLIYNGLSIVGGVLLRHRGIEGFCWGVLAGAWAGNLILPWLAVRRGDGLRLRVCFAHPALRRFAWLALPLMLGQSIAVLDEQFVRLFGSLAGTGAVSWLNYARRLTMVPIGVVAQAAGVASFPFMADLVARRDFDRLHQTVNHTLRNLLTLLIPISAWMMIAAEPTVRLIFEQGRFGSADTAQTAVVLRVFLAMVFCWGVHQLISRAFYARQDTLTPALIGTVMTVLCLPLYWLLARLWQATGVAVASVLSIGLYTLVLSAWWARCHGRAVFAGLPWALLRLAVLSALAALPGWYLPALVPASLSARPYLGALAALVVSLAGFGVPFLMLSMLAIPDLLRPCLERLGPAGRLVLRCCRRS